MKVIKEFNNYEEFCEWAEQEKHRVWLLKEYPKDKYDVDYDEILNQLLVYEKGEIKDKF